ncbi:MAG: hypothetical protein AB8G14_07715 [Ilumatobacter sp.]
MDDMTTEVWRLSGATGSTPGLMFMQGQMVTLQLEVAESDDLRSVFSVPLESIADVNWPKLQMSGGCNFVVNGEKYRLSFLKPQNSRPLAATAGAAAGLASISGGRKAGKAWRAILPG